jgi:hypothetical protein
METQKLQQSIQQFQQIVSEREVLLKQLAKAKQQEVLMIEQVQKVESDMN